MIAHDPSNGAISFGGPPIFGLLQPTPTAFPISSVQLNQLALEIVFGSESSDDNSDEEEPGDVISPSDPLDPSNPTNTGNEGNTGDGEDLDDEDPSDGSGSNGYATQTLDTSYNFVVLNNLDPEMATFNEEMFNESVRYDETALSSDSMTNTLSTQHYANRDQSPFPNENGVYAIEHQLTVDTGDVVIEVTGIDTGANIPFVAFHNNQIYYSKEAHGSDGSHLPSSLEILNAQAGDEIDLVVASNPTTHTPIHLMFQAT